MNRDRFIILYYMGSLGNGGFNGQQGSLLRKYGNIDVRLPEMDCGNIDVR